MSAVPKNFFFTHVHNKWLQMYGENKNPYNSVRNININNDTPQKEKKIQYNTI